MLRDSKARGRTIKRYFPGSACFATELSLLHPPQLEIPFGRRLKFTASCQVKPLASSRLPAAPPERWSRDARRDLDAGVFVGLPRLFQSAKGSCRFAGPARSRTVASRRVSNASSSAIYPRPVIRALPAIAAHGSPRHEPSLLFGSHPAPQKKTDTRSGRRV